MNSNETNNIETGKKSFKKKKNVQNIKLENKFQIPDVWKKDPYSYIYFKKKLCFLKLNYLFVTVKISKFFLIKTDKQT